MNELTSIITAQRVLQRRLGYDFAAMNDQEMIQYLTEMILAAQVELVEALNEMTWKSWATGCSINRGLFQKELIDVLHFFINMFLALHPDATDEEIAGTIQVVFFDKNAVNHQRQDAGYDAKSTKCPHCGRAADDITFSEVRLAYDTLRICVCNGVFDVIPNDVADRS